MSTFEGEIKYTDGEKLVFEVNELGQLKIKIDGTTQYEPPDHLAQLNYAITAVYNLLRTCSPKKFMMREKNKDGGLRHGARLSGLE